MKPTDHISLLVTAGDGPAECRQAVAAVLRRMEEEAVTYGIALSLHQTAEKHGPRSAVVTIHGAAREGFAKRWRGTIQWTAQSRLRPHHKRRNWFVGVFALDNAPAQARAIRAEDVAISTLRAGGPGGQHQNTTDSAVRARHTPTGLTLVVRDGRSQHRNRALALERLQALANAQAASDLEDRKDALNRLHHNLQRGAPTRRFKGGAFREVE